MDFPTLELKPLKEENGPMTGDGSNGHYPRNPSPLPPYSDIDRDFVVSECIEFSSNGNTINIDDTSGNETRDTTIPETNDRTVLHCCSFYAMICFLATSILVFAEVQDGPISLLYLQGCMFSYLVGVSVLIFVGTYIRMLMRRRPEFMNEKYGSGTEKSSTSMMKNLLNSDVSICLRIGALVFGCGTLISCAMEIVSFFSAPSKCMDDLNFTQTVLKALFSFLQIPFIVMNFSEIIHKLGCIQHVVLTHLIATNLCIWIRQVLLEIAKDWLDATHVKHNSSTAWPSKEFSTTVHTLEFDKKSSDVSQHIPTHNIRFTTNCYWREPEEGKKTENLIEISTCLQNSTIGAKWMTAQPYLYPFMVQYSLVAAGIVYIMWSHIQNSPTKLKQVTTVSMNEHSNEQQVSGVGSSKGFFFVLSIMAAIVISLILFFMLAENDDFTKLHQSSGLHCTLLALLTLTALFGKVQIKKMKGQTKQRRQFMYFVQMIIMCIVCVFGICNMTVGIISIVEMRYCLLFVDGVWIILQAFAQFLLIDEISDKRLQPASKNDTRGRRAIIVLVLTNMLLWLQESHMAQHKINNMLQLQFFGDFFWSVISRIVIPLVILYRFQSAVALMEALRKS